MARVPTHETSPTSRRRVEWPTLAEQEVVQLSPRDSQAFVEALLNPREPSDEMRKRVTTYLGLMGDR